MIMLKVNYNSCRLKWQTDVLCLMKALMIGINDAQILTSNINLHL